MASVVGASAVGSATGSSRAAILRLQRLRRLQKTGYLAIPPQLTLAKADQEARGQHRGQRQPRSGGPRSDGHRGQQGRGQGEPQDASTHHHFACNTAGAVHPPPPQCGEAGRKRQDARIAPGGRAGTPGYNTTQRTSKPCVACSAGKLGQENAPITPSLTSVLVSQGASQQLGRQIAPQEGRLQAERAGRAGGINGQADRGGDVITDQQAAGRRSH